MRLLQLSLRSLLIYSLIVVLISIPLSLYFIHAILKEEVDESLQLHTEQFLNHIKGFEYLDDLDTDLIVFDKLSYNMSIRQVQEGYPDKAYQTIEVYDSIEQEIHPFRQLSTPVDIKNKHYLLTVQISLFDTEDLLFAIGSVQVISIILLVTGLGFINRSLSKRLWKPFYKTLDQLKAFQVDRNEPFEIVETKITEFDDLNHTVKQLTDRNRSVYMQQKEFIENASHELQTPIAIFQSKLDNLMQSSSLQASDASTLSELEQTAQRMARLNKNLLLLSKIDNDQFRNTETIDVAKVLHGIVENVKHVADAENISISLRSEPITIEANKTLIEILLTNLLHNAVRHNQPGGSLMIELRNSKLVISNSGAPLKMDPEKIFERFSKEGATENNTGLGLAIVKKICTTSGYQIDYQYNNELHVFTLLLL